jgi:hypothetical protein
MKLSTTFVLNRPLPLYCYAEGRFQVMNMIILRQGNDEQIRFEFGEKRMPSLVSARPNFYILPFYCYAECLDAVMLGPLFRKLQVSDNRASRGSELHQIKVEGTSWGMTIGSNRGKMLRKKYFFPLLRS